MMFTMTLVLIISFNYILKLKSNENIKNNIYKYLSTKKKL